MVMQEFDHTEGLKLLTPVISWHVDHSSQKLEQKICMLVRLLGKLNVAIHKLFQRFERIWVELGDIAANFK